MVNGKYQICLSSVAFMLRSSELHDIGVIQRDHAALIGQRGLLQLLLTLCNAGRLDIKRFNTQVKQDLRVRMSAFCLYLFTVSRLQVSVSKLSMLC